MNLLVRSSTSVHEQCCLLAPACRVSLYILARELGCLRRCPTEVEYCFPLSPRTDPSLINFMSAHITKPWEEDVLTEQNGRRFCRAFFGLSVQQHCVCLFSPIWMSFNCLHLPELKSFIISPLVSQPSLMDPILIRPLYSTSHVFLSIYQPHAI
jgi:hypothetical protein